MLSSLRDSGFEARILSNGITKYFFTTKIYEGKLVKLTKKLQTKLKTKESDQETKIIKGKQRKMISKH